ncbi:hypothetical protein TNCT_189921 [Trichonephila clavata]|uniref:Uncharacterized protein n=1 Tax=Trichonephila clavata TaxID=2740835 RepID=A0A8X6INM5_TRICU|nr:hypothetical protein TNCT_189921 [Trichonephila clavata]
MRLVTEEDIVPLTSFSINILTKKYDIKSGKVSVLKIAFYDTPLDSSAEAEVIQTVQLSNERSYKVD